MPSRLILLVAMLGSWAGAGWAQQPPTVPISGGAPPGDSPVMVWPRAVEPAAAGVPAASAAEHAGQPVVRRHRSADEPAVRPALFEQPAATSVPSDAVGRPPAVMATAAHEPLPADAPTAAAAAVGAKPAGAGSNAGGERAGPGRTPLSTPLPPAGRVRNESARTASGDAAQPRPQPKTPASLVTVGSSLVVVVGLFLLVAWVLKRTAPGHAPPLPTEVFQVLGRSPLAGRQQVHLLRCGNKLLLVSLSAAGAETLTEITEPLEVDRLAGLCLQSHPTSATSAFRQVLQQFAQPADRAARRETRPAGARRAPTLDDLEAEPHG